MFHNGSLVQKPRFEFRSHGDWMTRRLAESLGTWRLGPMPIGFESA